MTGKCRNCKYRNEDNVCTCTNTRVHKNCTITVGYGMSKKYMYGPKTINIGWRVAL